MTEVRRISLSTWIAQHAPDKLAAARKLTEDWIMEYTPREQMEQQFHDLLGDTWIAWKALRRITK